MDVQGHPLSDVEVSAVRIDGTDPSHLGLTVEGRGRTRPDGSFEVRAFMGPHRLMVRAQLGANWYRPVLSSEFDLKIGDVAMAGFEMNLTPVIPASLSVAITPIRGAQEEDLLSLEQVLTADGIDYTLSVGTLKPDLLGDWETASFSNQPPGTYTLSLWRSVTTGTHPTTGSAKATVTLAEGSATELPLAVK